MLNKDFYEKRKQASMTVNTVSYKIEIPMKDFDKLCDSELEGKHPELINVLADTFKLDKRNIDFNGHFGNFIYLEIDNDKNTIDLREKILDKIFEHLQMISN